MLYWHTLPASNFAIVGLVMFVISLLFGGFSILFFQIREIMRATWMQSYSAHKPPSARRARLAFPESS
jgi:hypothetical protein